MLRACAATTVAVLALSPWLSAQETEERRAALREVVGMTVPFRDATMASVQPARIAEILAAEGGTVSKGVTVVVLEDGVQAARTAIAEAQAASTLEVDLARIRWLHAKQELDRLITLSGHDQASTKELSDMRTTAEEARLEYEIADFKLSQARAAYRRERELLELYRIRAPFDGYVAGHMKHPGESVDHLEGIVRLVQLDPILVTVDCPLDLSPRVSVGEGFWILPADPRRPAREGEVVFASRVADGASQTFKVKLSVANGDLAWPVGMKVAVDFLRASDSARGKPTEPESADVATPAGGAQGTVVNRRKGQ